jgi:hypothetical protein
MNKKVLYGLGIIIVLAIVFFWKQHLISEYAAPDSDDMMQATTSVVQSNHLAQGVQGQPAQVSPVSHVTKAQATKSFHTIFTQSGNHECEYDQVTSSGKASHRIYISKGKMRGEFRTVTGPNINSTIMVFDGYDLYTWTEGTTKGTISDLTSVSQLPVAIPSDLTSGAIYGSSSNSVGWNCHTWITDNSLLTSPSYVKFSSR